MVTWFRDQGCPLSTMLFEEVAGYGQLEVLMWLREHRCPADIGECAFRAARGGHGEVVDWLGQFTHAAWWHHAAN